MIVPFVISQAWQYIYTPKMCSLCFIYCTPDKTYRLFWLDPVFNESSWILSSSLSRPSWWFLVTSWIEALQLIRVLYVATASAAALFQFHVLIIFSYHNCGYNLFHILINFSYNFYSNLLYVITVLNYFGAKLSRCQIAPVQIVL